MYSYNMMEEYPPPDKGWEDNYKEWVAQNKDEVRGWGINYTMKNIDVLTLTMKDKRKITFIRKKIEHVHT